MRYVLMILAATSLAACGGNDQDTTLETDPNAGAPAGEMPVTDALPESMANNLPTDGPGYVQAAGASDLYEIQSSELALEKAQADEVREFARQMIEDHQRTTDLVATAAQSAGLTPGTPQLMPMQQDMVNQLQSASGAEFDRLYVQQQRQAHQMALSLHRNFAENGTGDELRQVAEGAVPVIEEHISHLEGMDAG